MANELLSLCPVCGQRLHITTLQCNQCHTTIAGDFELDALSALSKQQKYFIEVFLRCRGNIREVEKEMGISYPTVRARLDEVIVALGYQINTENENEEVLRMLKSGEITREEAMRRLK